MRIWGGGGGGGARAQAPLNFARYNFIIYNVLIFALQNSR